MKQLETKFIDYLRFEKRYSEHTITAYAEDLSQFRHFLLSNYNTLLIEEIKPIHVRSWLASLSENGLTARSIHRKISSLNTFFRFLHKNNIITSSPTKNIKKPKIEKRLANFVRQDKMPNLIDEIAPDPTNPTIDSYNKQLIIELLYQTGMRRSELVALRLANIDLSNRQIKVLGKGNKERIIPINAELANLIENYLSIRASLMEVQHDQLLVLSNGKAIYSKYIYNQVNEVLKSAANLKKNSPHILRHTFATHLLNEGADINAIKELLGHASLAATQVYTHNSIEKLKNVYKNAHPKS